MKVDSLRFAPPDDNHFQSLMLRASRGQISVYGAVIETMKVKIKRAFDSHRPETKEGGAEVLQAMWRAWQEGNPVQPWLYAKNDSYIVSDDYFWLALMEKGRPGSFAAQILGDPLPTGLIQKVGPLPLDTVQSMIGKL